MTLLPARMRDSLQAQIALVKLPHDAELAAGRGEVVDRDPLPLDH